MDDSERKIKHFIFIRFFPKQDPKYPHDIYDVIFLTKQLLLAKHNALKSLENQTNKNFEIVFIVNPNFFDNPKYEFVFSTLRYATALSLRFVKRDEIPLLVKAALNKYDFVIQSGMDLDDFIFKDAIADIWSKIAKCENILVYGYCKGYAYYDGDLSPYNQRFNGIGHVAILHSLILKSSYAKNMPFIGIYSFPHHLFKDRMKKFLEQNGIKFSEKMFQQNTSTKAYIYFRHKFSHNSLVTNPCDLKEVFQKKIKITNEDGLTKEKLKSEFGFEYKFNSIE